VSDGLVERLWHWSYLKPRLKSFITAGVLVGVLAMLPVVYKAQCYLSRLNDELLVSYRHDMQLAQRAAEEGDFEEVRRLLDRERPTRWDSQDPRGSDWYELDSKARGFLGQIHIGWAAILDGKWSPDSQRLAILYMTQRNAWVMELAVWEAGTELQLSEYPPDYKELGDWDSANKTIALKTFRDVQDGKLKLDFNGTNFVVLSGGVMCPKGMPQPFWSPDRSCYAQRDKNSHFISVWRGPGEK
jgi:hypothetical protein